MNAGQLHDILMNEGAGLMLQTVKKIEQGNIVLTEQNKLLANQQAKHAPKIFKDTCQINWKDTLENIYNLIRGLSPYPCAWTELQAGDKKQSLKFIRQSKKKRNTIYLPGKLKQIIKRF
jgi:methionyl-tRNA formyltransferase